MLFCCLWRNVEASCHKHFVVVSSPAVNKLRRLRATSVIKSPWSVAAECIALVALAVTCRSNRSQHAMEPYIASELRFLPEFDVLVRGSPSKYRHDVWRGETRMVWLPDSENNLCFFSFWQNPQTWQTDIAWRHRLRWHSIARQKAQHVRTCNIQ